MLTNVKKTVKMSLFAGILFIVGCMTAQPQSGRQVAIQSKLLQHINTAVFEVVIPKQTNDSLKYEKELPMHLLPYSIRKDTFHSIGTAFAIGKNTFLSAAHVIDLGERSQYEKFYLRDKNGKTYELDQVYKYSNYHDFIVFSVKGQVNTGKPFVLSTDIQMNKPVFAVGNAFGEGIIARNGILTSQTPEDEEGAWKWLRFSAAASPGNSGGPLLDSAGKVIGVVVRKSENENLNYALPISEVIKFKNNTALEHYRFVYRLLNTERKERFNYDYKTSLPKKYPVLRNELLKNSESYNRKMHNNFLAGFKDKMFPKGKGSLKLLHTSVSRTFGGLICENENEEWATYYPKNIGSEELENNGYIQIGAFGSLAFMRIDNPDNVKLKEMVENPGENLKQIVKAIPFTRTIMGDKTRITSFGNPVSKEIHVDSNSRTWIVSTWYVEYDDSKIIMFTLPVPGGSFNMMARVGTDSLYKLDMEYLTDFVHLGYAGTFKEWDEFLKLRKYLPKLFLDQKFKYTPNVKASYASKRFNFNYKNDFQKISDDSVMALSLGYFSESGRVKWDVVDLVVLEHKDRATAFYASKILKPAKGLNDEYFSAWKKRDAEEYPYNSTPFFNESKTIISSVYKPKVSMDQYLYTLGFIYEGKHEDDIMKEKMVLTKKVLNFQ